MGISFEKEPEEGWMEKGLKSGINFDEYCALTAIVLRDYNAAFLCHC